MKRIFGLFLFVFLLATCSESSDVSLPADSGGSGQGGSLARFTIIGDYLYTLEPSQLRWYRIGTNGDLEPEGQIGVSTGKETIFPLGDLLFLGAVDGMSIYQVDDEGTPVFQSEVFHIVACDPVVANEDYAFVTLRTESCRQFGGPVAANLLNIYDVNDIENPEIIASYNLVSPRGLGLAGDYLFICEGSFGLRTLDIRDPLNVDFIRFDQDIHANDVIVLPEMLLVIGPDNITQFDYSDPTNLVKISEILL